MNRSFSQFKATREVGSYPGKRKGARREGAYKRDFTVLNRVTFYLDTFSVSTPLSCQILVDIIANHSYSFFGYLFQNFNASELQRFCEEFLLLNLPVMTDNKVFRDVVFDQGGKDVSMLNYYYSIKQE